MQWTLVVKVKLAAVLFGTVALLAGLGQWVILLRDPRGPTILANMANPLVSIPLLVAMLSVVALAGTLLLHRDIPGVVWLILGAAWAGLAFRSWPIDNRLIFMPVEALPGFYARLLAEFVLFGSITGIIGVLVGWLVTLLPLPGKGAADGAESADVDISPKDGPLSFAAGWMVAVGQVLLATLAAAAIYLLLLGAGLVQGQLPGQLLRGQILFALIGGFALASFAIHQLVPTRNPCWLVVAVASAGVLFYATSMFWQAGESAQAGERFAYQPTTRLGAMLPIDLLGLALAATIAGYLVSFRLIQLRRQHKRQAEKP